MNIHPLGTVPGLSKVDSLSSGNLVNFFGLIGRALSQNLPRQAKMLAAFAELSVPIF